MRAIILLLSLVLALSCTPEKKYDLVISNIGFFDGNVDKGVVNIGIHQDTIAVVSVNKILADSIIDGTGKYIIPGLVNSHCHIWTEEQLKEGYEVGILADIGLHTSDEVRDQKIKELSKKEGYPFYYTSGFAATVPGGHPTQASNNIIETINDSISVKTWVDNRIANNADLIKIVRHGRAFRVEGLIPTLSYDSIQKIIDYARQKQLKTVVHIGTREEMLTIAKLKPDGFAHMWQYAEDTPLTNEMVNTIKNSGSFVISTLIISERAFQMFAQRGGVPKGFPKKMMVEKGKLLIKKLHDAGIMFVAGTDNGNFNLNWGDDLFAALKIYSEAGLTNLEVLKTATGNAAKAWDIPIGTLKVGSDLNMILINGNPLDDLENLRKIERIWKNRKSN